MYSIRTSLVPFFLQQLTLFLSYYSTKMREQCGIVFGVSAHLRNRLIFNSLEIRPNGGAIEAKRDGRLGLITPPFGQFAIQIVPVARIVWPI